MYNPNRIEKEKFAKLCLMMDCMRDEMKVSELLAVPQNIPATIALKRLKKLLRERRNTYLA